MSAPVPTTPANGQGPNDTPRQHPTSKRLQQTQAQVDEVVDIMRTNVEKVLERDQKLSQLDDRAALDEEREAHGYHGNRRVHHSYRYYHIGDEVNCPNQPIPIAFI
ncbi:unnamed protein product [Dicrocoelium dendriticum]|nr:unnamed protein product [Dicrocoelium dendriticum]